MKTLLVLTLALLASTSAMADLKKEIWTCQNAEMKLQATLSPESYIATLDHDSVDETVALKLKREGQTNALTGSQRTELKGEYVGWDSYYYKITLIRNRMEDFHPGGSKNESVTGSVMMEIDAELDCYGRRLDVVTMDCQVRIVRQ